MKITAIKTKKITVGDDLHKILDQFLPKLSEKDILAISSKIIAITEGDVIKDDGKISKMDVMKKEADFYLPEEYTMHGIPLSIKNKTMGSGVDLSNGNGYFILWPKNLQEKTNEIWEYLRKKNKIKNLGIVVTDGRIMPLRKGVTGIGISWCGFEPLRNYIGKPDIFGRQLSVTKTTIVDSLAASAVLNMGEGNEQTPLAIISDVPNIKFVDRVPNKEELDEMHIDLKDDVFAKILDTVPWIKGGNGK